jgi:hypothetical protein
MAASRHCRIALLAALAVVLLVRGIASAEDDAEQPARPWTPPVEFQEFLTSIAREHLPDKYEKSKNWGHTKRVVSGLRVELDGLRLETRRRYRDVNDGAWQKYRIDILDPDKHFEVKLHSLRQEENKVLGKVIVEARLKVFGRHSQWERGVQLFSVSAEATARVRLTASVECTARLDASKLPPDVILSPRVTAADLKILDFELQRVGELSGPGVESLSHTVREILEERIAERRHKLVERLNKSLAKREEKFRLSASDLLDLPVPQSVPSAEAASPAER